MSAMPKAFEMRRKVSIVRIYFRYGQRQPGTSFWQRLLGDSLSWTLLKRAKAMNIVQANVFTAKAGYLQNELISYNLTETPPSGNTVCLELIDNHERLDAYLEENQSLLSETVIILVNNDCFRSMSFNCPAST